MSELADFPKRSHPNCDRERCDTCLKDHDLLDKYLSTRIDPNRRTDALGRYRSWLDKNKIHAETNGWASREAWEKEVVDTFIQQQTNPAPDELKDLK